MTDTEGRRLREGERLQAMSVALKPSQWERLEQQARSEETSIARVLRRIVQDWEMSRGFEGG